MAGFYYHLEHKEVIHIKVKKLDGKAQPEYKKFSIDPEITSFEMLQNILARAFNTKSDFTISYLTRNSKGHEVYLAMLSDWDMDAAFQCAAEPFLKLRVDLRPFEELEGWDVIAPNDVPPYGMSGLSDKTSILGTITGAITHNFGKTVNSMQRAMGFKLSEHETIKPIKAHMTEAEFRIYLDSAGFMIKPHEFRLSVFQGGIEPAFRKVAWRHLLNIFPANMSSKDRFNYLKQKEEEYHRLRDEWRDRFSKRTALEEVKHVVSMVKKDVLRTDRSHEFYAGNDENANTVSLFHILVTYALTHPDVSYCQGMSDLASPLLVTQKNEGQAYICFCALMERVRENFTPDGTAIVTKFRHLSELLCMYDPVLYNHLLQNSAEDMFFCYRWFLLEVKREFPLNDALRVLEVMWATLPHNPPKGELALVDPDYSSRLLSTSPSSPQFSLQHAMYARLLAIRRSGIHLAKTIPSPTSRASTINNLSIEQSPNPSDSNTNQNIISSYDSSPHEPSSSHSDSSPQEPSPNHSDSNTNQSIISSFDSSHSDGEDREAEFPKMNNSVSCTMQQSSDNINHSLRGQYWQNCNNEIRNNHSEDNEDVFGCHGDTDDIGRDDRLWTFTSSYYSCNTKSHARDDDQCYSCPDLVDFYNGTLKEQSSGFHITDFNCELNTGRQSSSLNSVASESSETDNLQTQFSLSLDSNINHSTDSSSATAELNNCISSAGSSGSECEKDNAKCGQSRSENKDFSGTESNQSHFQRVKQLLAAPTQQFCTTRTEAGSLQLSSLRRPSTLASKRHHLNLILSGGTEKSELAKNMSDSHISECQEATEELGSPERISSFTNSPAKDPSKLPVPQELGAGNPFLMFLCLTMLVQHRASIINQDMCYEEIAMHFDRLVRKHNANIVLHFARQTYTEYLKAQQEIMEAGNGDDDELGFSCG